MSQLAPPRLLDVTPLERKIHRLRGRLLGWVLVAGMGQILAWTLGIAALDMALDRLFRMDFAQRSIMLGLMAAAVLALVYRRLVRPLEGKPADTALVLQVERRHPELNETLISGLQLAREPRVEQAGYSPRLVEATVGEAVRRSEQIDFGSVLDPLESRRNWTVLAFALLASIGLAAAATRGGFVNTWFRRNVLLENVPWPQATYLLIADTAGGQLRIDRGADFDLRVLVTEQSRVREVSVQIEFDYGSERSFQRATATGRFDGREHVLPLRHVNQEFRVRAAGGDGLTPWVDVRLVEPIDVAELELKAIWPEYVGGSRVLQGAGPHSLLAGSQLELKVTANLPIDTARVLWNAAADPDGAAAATAADEAWPMTRLDETHFALRLPGPPGPAELAGGKYSFQLIEEGGRTNQRPVAIELTIAADQPPQLAASLSGISGLVVSRARVPISFQAVDRFGLRETAVHYQWKPLEEQAELRTGRLAASPIAADQLRYSELDQEYSTARRVELDLEPLGLPAGVVLGLTALARDNQPDEAAGTGRSRDFLLRIVTEDELRADLLRREVEQRTLFQQLRENQLQILTELRALAAAAADSPPSGDEPQRRLLESQNRQKSLGTNLRQIADRFQDFLAEARNNRLDESEREFSRELQEQTPSALSFEQRYGERIIAPIVALDEVEIYQAGQAIEQARGLSDPASFRTAIGSLAELQESIVARMDQILAAMEDSQTYQEIVNQVISLKRMEQAMLEAVKRKRDPANPGGIFDRPRDPDRPPDAPQDR